MVNLVKCTNSINILVDLAIPTNACEIFGQNMCLQCSWKQYAIAMYLVLNNKFPSSGIVDNACIFNSYPQPYDDIWAHHSTWNPMLSIDILTSPRPKVSIKVVILNLHYQYPLMHLLMSLCFHAYVYFTLFN
jgi:hypothetical protein